MSTGTALLTHDFWCVREPDADPVQTGQEDFCHGQLPLQGSSEHGSAGSLSDYEP